MSVTHWSILWHSMLCKVFYPFLTLTVTAKYPFGLSKISVGLKLTRGHKMVFTWFSFILVSNLFDIPSRYWPEPKSDVTLSVNLHVSLNYKTPRSLLYGEGKNKRKITSTEILFENYYCLWVFYKRSRTTWVKRTKGHIGKEDLRPSDSCVLILFR